MNSPTPVSLALAQMNIPHREFRHVGPVRSLEQAATERGQQPEQIIRSILFRLSADTFVMVLMAGPQQIDWKALRQYLDEKRLTMASEEEVRRVTGYERGAVAPFGLPAPLRILADESIFTPEEVSLGSGVRGTTIILSSADLRRALGNVELVRLSKDST
ncbi:MAG: YbaK/EbsC family protein [Anaerolineales bacterium]|nr:YbaK/EbsC family protein [Anaerolineales bacterium]